LERLAECRYIVGKTGTGGGFKTLPPLLSIDKTLEDEFLRCNELGLDIEPMDNNWLEVALGRPALRMECADRDMEEGSKEGDVPPDVRD
jgi:hypothetical protein